eukprot:3898816-Heterocapsa_arctica.AAC.1
MAVLALQQEAAHLARAQIMEMLRRAAEFRHAQARSTCGTTTSGSTRLRRTSMHEVRDDP